MDSEISKSAVSDIGNPGAPEPQAVSVKRRPHQHDPFGGAAGRLVTQSQIYPTTTASDPNEGRHSPSRGRRTSGGILIDDTHEAPAPAVKMVGYLEKRSKMIGWKRYWFVLDGSLLTYYRTKADYDSSLAACLGSINLGLASSVRPLQIRACKGYPLQITTRTQIYYLRSADKAVLEKWLIALQETTSVPPSISSPTWADPGVQFYRYSFASGSQWSLALSTDDISGSLRDLPRNFYLKPGALGRGGAFGGQTPSHMSKDKSQSLACLNVTAQPRASAPPAVPPGLGARANVINESTAVMPKPSANAQAALAQLRSPGAGLRPGSLTTSPAPPAKPVRQATSMLVLANSNTEAELRRELTAKINAGALFKRSSPNIKGLEPEDSAPESEVRDSGAHAYDEIIDFEANYGPKESQSQSRPASESTHSDRASVVSSGSVPSSPTPVLELPVDPQRVPSPNRSSNHAPSGPSPWEMRRDRADVTQSRIIYHVEEEVGAGAGSSNSSESNSGKGRKKKGIGGFFQKMFKKDKEKDKDLGGGVDKRDRSGSASSTTSSRSSRRGRDRGSDREPVITGPVDLRATAAATRDRANTTGSTKSVTTPSAVPTSTCTSTIPAPKAQAVVAVDPRHPPPRSPQLDNMMAELKTKVEQINGGAGAGKQPSRRPELKVDINAAAASRSVADGSSPMTKQTLRTPPPPPSTPRPKTPEHYENNLGKFNRLSAHLNPTFVAALNKGPGASAPNGHGANASVAANTNGNGGAVSMYRSNTLPASGRYGHSVPVPKEEPPLLPPKKRRAGEPPLAPTTEALAPAYDVPQNNQPITMENQAGLVDMSSVYGHGQNHNGGANGVVDHRALPSATTSGRMSLRDLTKKHSAPDIMFQSQLRPITCTSSTDVEDGDLDILLQLNIVPPPPPPFPEHEELQMHPSECPCQAWGHDHDEGYEDLPPPLPLAPAPNLATVSQNLPNLPSVIVLDEEGGPRDGSNSPKSIDIDNLDALSDISTSNTTPPPTPFAQGAGLYSADADTVGGGGNLYENVSPLKYATINTIVEELETVEENEDELYDEFVVQDSHAVAIEKSRAAAAAAVGKRPPQPLPPPTARTATSSGSRGGEDDDVFEADTPITTNSGRRVQSVRHSGIDALQQYLYQDPAGNASNGKPPSPLHGGGGAINRLGHSAAINQLHALLQNDNK